MMQPEKEADFTNQVLKRGKMVVLLRFYKGKAKKYNIQISKEEF